MRYLVLLTFITLSACSHTTEPQGIGGGTNDFKESKCACELIYDGVPLWQTS